jgi:hypothetical protein
MATSAGMANKTPGADSVLEQTGQRVVEQPQGGQETIHGAVQRVPIEALGCLFTHWLFPLGRWRWWRGEWNLVRCALRNRDGLGWCIGLWQERKSSFRSRLPSQSTENFSNHHLTESSRPAIPRLLRPRVLRRRIVRSRAVGLGPVEAPAGRPSGRTRAFSPPECRRCWKRRRVRVE